RKILFSLGEKEIRRAQNEKSKEYFSVVWRAERAVAGLASLVWFRSAVFDKMGSSQTVKTHKKNFLVAFVIIVIPYESSFVPSRTLLGC
ncbi:MAG: hypothetical protein UY09_C0052G0010, partial [Parcubacteria group bacterium GW2011_GWA2_47_8]